MASLSPLKKQERIALETIAKRFSATRGKGSRSYTTHAIIGGKRVFVDIITPTPRGPSQGKAAKPRLRFDRVATGLIERLRAAFDEVVPDGTTVLLTVTAPILLPAKTAVSLQGKIHGLLGRRSQGRDEKDTIHGNRVRIRVVRGGAEGAPKLIGFVHNPDSDPLLLFDITGELLELPKAAIARRAPRLAGDRWLIVRSSQDISCLEAYRYIYSQLRAVTVFEKIFMVFRDGRIGILAE